MAIKTPKDVLSADCPICHKNEGQWLTIGIAPLHYAHQVTIFCCAICGYLIERFNVIPKIKEVIK